MRRCSGVSNPPAANVGNPHGIEASVRGLLPPEPPAFPSIGKIPPQARVDEALEGAKGRARIGVSIIIHPPFDGLVALPHKRIGRHRGAPLGDGLDPSTDTALPGLARENSDVPFPAGRTPSSHKVAPERVKPLGPLGDARLGAVDEEVHTRHNRFERVQRLLGLAPTDQDGSIGIAMQRGPERGRRPPAVPDLSQEVQVDMAIQRCQGCPLRDPFRCWRDLALLPAPRLQAVVDEPPQPPIPHPLPDKPEQLAVRNGQQVALAIAFHHSPGPSREVSAEGSDAIFASLCGR